MRTLFLVVLFTGAPALSQAADDLARAIAPLREGVPEVAVARLEELLSKPGTDRAAILVRLAEAHTAAGRPQEALPLLADPLLRNNPEASFGKAQALAALGRWSESAQAYAAVLPSKNPTLSARARFGLAEAERALGRSDAALSNYRALLDDPVLGTEARFRSVDLLLQKNNVAGATTTLEAVEAKTPAERKARRFWRGRVAAADGNKARAIASFRAVLRKPEGASHELILAALHALAGTQSPADAAETLEAYLDSHPADRALPELFARLETIYQGTRKPWRTEFRRWIRDPAQPRRAFAQWYQARAELKAGRPAEAAALFRQMQREGFRHPALAVAYLGAARLQAAQGQPAAALELLEAAAGLSPEPAFRHEIEWLRAATIYQAGDFAGAAEAFAGVAAAGRDRAEAARFNSALSWLQADAPEKFREAYRRVANEKDAKAGDLLLEEGLSLAAKNTAKAEEALRRFTRDHPDHARIDEAWLALAELAFHRQPPGINEARQLLKRLDPARSGPRVREDAAFLRVWLEEARPEASENAVRARALDFLREFPESPRAPEVRMKLAELYWDQQDFANAQTQFETLARRHPQHPLAEKALFFAGQSARSTMGPDALDRALSLFNEVAARQGELQWTARNEQAMIERKLGKNDEALLLYEQVLAQSGKAADRREALTGSGDVHFERGTANPEDYRRALQFYERLIADTQAGSHWRNQALYKKALALDKLGETAAALAAYYEVLEQPLRAERAPELFWYYKAGFDAAQLLERQEKWESAAAIYEKLVGAAGPRSAEAAARLKRLRLEHFLWP